VRISVHDMGIGIPNDKQGVIFEAFQQADGSTSRRYGGTGLGLTISTQLAELLGGRIELKSQEGQGSTFSLLLPLSHTPGQAHDSGRAEDEAAEASPPSAPELADTDFLGAQVLVLDDDVQTLLSLTPLLERWGLRVTVAGDYGEAIEALSEEPDCGVILMDALMPGLDPCATIQSLRAQSACDSVPVIALIADASAEAVQACLAAGADDAIAKPVDAQALKEMLVSRLPVHNLPQPP